MRVENLPSPGATANGHRLRVESARALSVTEVHASKVPNPLAPALPAATASQVTLRAFFNACAAAVAPMLPPPPV